MSTNKSLNRSTNDVTCHNSQKSKDCLRPSIHPVVASIHAANIPIAKIFLNDLASVRDDNFFPVSPFVGRTHFEVESNIVVFVAGFSTYGSIYLSIYIYI
jgi:hypothetical protein